MGAYSIFLIRAVLAVVLAFFISRVFFQGMDTAKVLGLAAILFGLAYLFEYLRKRDEEDDHGS